MLKRNSSAQRRAFIKQTFAGVAGLSVGALVSTGLGQPPREPYGSPSHRTEGKPPRVKTKLRITKLETLLVKPRWLFLKMHTDEGIIGWGEPITEGRAKTCAAAVAEIAPYLIGKDPRNIIHHWQAI